MPQSWRRRTSAAEAALICGAYGTAEAVPLRKPRAARCDAGPEAVPLRKPRATRCDAGPEAVALRKSRCADRQDSERGL